MRNYVLILPYGAFDNYMYRDLMKLECVNTYFLNKPTSNKIINFMKRIHRSCSLNNCVNLPFKGVWSYSLIHLISDDTFLIFDTGALSMLSMTFLEKIKNSPKRPKMGVVVVDSMHAHSSHMKIAKPIILGFEWDIVLSFDSKDCNEYGFKYVGQTLYSKITDICPSKNESDIYFVGRNKNNRNMMVEKIFKLLKKDGVKCNFNLGNANLKNFFFSKENGGIREFYYNLPYSEVLADILSTSCILEVMQEGQNAQTARYYEAVCYNKKLLTNNESVKKLPFYNSDYIKVFHSIDEIDAGWIKDNKEVNFGYNNEFSPLKIIDLINE